MKDFIKGHIKPEQIKVLKKNHKLITVEFYSNRKSIIPKCEVQIYLTRNTLFRNSKLSEELLLLKQAAETQWLEFDYKKDLYFGYLYFTGKKGGRKVKLENSFFIFNNNMKKIILSIWGQPFEFDLSASEHYNSGYVDFLSGEKANNSNWKIVNKINNQIQKSLDCQQSNVISLDKIKNRFNIKVPNPDYLYYRDFVGWVDKFSESDLIDLFVAHYNNKPYPTTDMSMKMFLEIFNNRKIA